MKGRTREFGHRRHSGNPAIDGLLQAVYRARLILFHMVATRTSQHTVTVRLGATFSYHGTSFNGLAEVGAPATGLSPSPGGRVPADFGAGRNVPLDRRS